MNDSRVTSLMSRAMTYSELLASKSPASKACGIKDPTFEDRLLKPFQRDIVRWALQQGRCAIFAGTGLGKTVMQLTWADAVATHTGGRILLLAPLAVAEQTVDEATKFAIGGVAYAAEQSAISSRITVTNYDRLHLFDTSLFSAVILDESSIIKSHDSKTRIALTEAFARTQWKLCCTATPNPNDYVELGNHAEFLGCITQKEMLSMFFVHDGKVRAPGSQGLDGWRLKRHAESAFWRWLASWAVVVRDPNEIGYDEPDYHLPPLTHKQIVVKVPVEPTGGYLFPMEARTLSERIAARRSSLSSRVACAASIVNREPNKPWLIWCGLNSESSALAKAIPESKEVVGAESREQKAQKLMGFIRGDPRVLISKPSIAGFGLNYQHCADMVFVGLNDSFEQLFQAQRRCWRFGQKNQVNVYLIASELEGAVVANLQRKNADYEKMTKAMTEHMRRLVKEQLQNVRPSGGADYFPLAEMRVPQWAL